MTKITFKDLPDTSTPLNASNLNTLQDNVENAINTVAGDIPTIDSSVSTSSTNGVENQAITNYVDSEIGTLSSTLTTSIDLIKNYSTTETIIGKWINNKTIYRKVFEINSQTLPNNKWLFIDHNLGIATYINFWGFVSSGGNTQPIPRLVTDAVANWSIGCGDFTTNRVGIQFGSYYSSVDSGFIVLEYTKTTD